MVAKRHHAGKFRRVGVRRRMHAGEKVIQPRDRIGDPAETSHDHRRLVAKEEPGWAGAGYDEAAQRSQRCRGLTEFGLASCHLLLAVPYKSLGGTAAGGEVDWKVVALIAAGATVGRVMGLGSAAGCRPG